MTARRRLLLLALPGLLACGGPAPWPPDPAEVRLGEDACAECRMFVSDGRFAAQMRLRDGSTEFFDDVGCLIERHGRGRGDPSGAFVRSADGARWLRLTEAVAVKARSITTPMGYGLLAFPSREAAAVEGGRHAGAVITSFEDLMRHGAPPVPGTAPETRKP